ncbi:hypothetical protein ACQEVY_25340 [Streptomyces sp. CA-288835]|uniref:hypothetical protein n=1 Tax=Streptomyces sp. CA-288835 TaxID=3240069 RepID=UPI003D8D29A1
MSADDLKKQLAKVKPGDYVTAFGKDTRGHEVTRVGTLLAEPKEMKATHNGVKVKAVRVCVGEKGTDPATRQTWTTLIPEHGFIRHAEPPKPGEWIHGEIRNIPAVRSARLDVNARLLFGGKGGKRSSEPKDDGTLAEISYAGAARYEVRAVESGEVIFTGSLQSQVWWAHAPEEDERQDQEPEAIEDQDQDQGDEEAKPEQAPQSVSTARRGVLFEGWLTGEQDPGDGRWTVVDNSRRRVIGWLTADHSQFVAAQGEVR